MLQDEDLYTLHEDEIQSLTSVEALELTKLPVMRVNVVSTLDSEAKKFLCDKDAAGVACPLFS